MQLKSDRMKGGLSKAPHRSLLKADGLTDEEISRPLVAVINSQNEIIPGHLMLDKVSAAVKAGIYMAGGTPLEISTIGVCDGIAMNHAGMRASLPRREVIADSVELAVSAHALVEEIQSHCTLLAAEKGDLAVSSSDCGSLAALDAAVAACRAFGFAEDKHVVILPGAQSILFRTDAALLGRVLLNLLKNALEAGGADTTVTATCTGQSPNRVRFSVHNDGVMPEYVRAHVFQRSFSTKGPGRGLGTYSMKLLGERYLGGKVSFTTGAEAGTVFSIRLPLPAAVGAGI